MAKDQEDPGFTPIFTDVAEMVGLSSAAVFGIVWRYSQRAHKRCHCSLKTMGGELNLARSTIQGHLRKLEGAGLIKKVSRAVAEEHIPPSYIYTYEPDYERNQKDKRQLREEVDAIYQYDD